MHIKIITSLRDKKWDTFVDDSINGTLFHKLRFLQYHPPKKFDFHHFLFYKKNELIAVLPAALQNNILRSPAGATYGSFVTSDLSFHEYEELIDTFILYAKKKSFKEVYLTLPPLVYMKYPNETLPFLLMYKGFRVKQRLISHVVSLDEFSLNTIKSQLSKRLRNDIKIAEKLGVTVKQSDDYASFYPILVENKKKFQTVPTHTYKELHKLVVLFPESVKLFLAYDTKQNAIGGVCVFITSAHTLLIFYISHLYSYHSLKPVSRLLYEVLYWAKKNNYLWLDFGVSMDTSSPNPMEPSRSLIFFKEGFHSRGYFRTTYYWKNV